jgi:DNA polymerase III sliding clamp (beta) subunit (PCNA family)
MRPEPPDTWSVEVPWEPVRRMAGKTLWATGADLARPSLHGTLFEYGRKPGLAEMCGTNGHILAWHHSTALADCGLPTFRVSVPPALWRAAWRVVGKGTETVRLSLRERRGSEFLVISTPTAEVSGRLAEGNYPNFRRVIPSYERPVKVRARKAALLAAALRSNGVSGRDNRRMRWRVSSGRLGIQTRIGETRSQVVQALEVVVGGLGDDGEFQIALDGEYLVSFLRNISGEEVHFDMLHPGRAIVIRSPEDPQFTGLLMPLRLDEAELPWTDDPDPLPMEEYDDD